MNKLKLTIIFLFMSLAASAQRLAVESLQLVPTIWTHVRIRMLISMASRVLC